MISFKICIHFVQRMHTAHNKEHSSEFDWVDLISSMIIFSDTERKCVCLLQSMHFRDLFWIFLSESTLIQVAITIFYDLKKKKKDQVGIQSLFRLPFIMIPVPLPATPSTNRDLP